jgi:DNA-binding protein HU-beta
MKARGSEGGSSVSKFVLFAGSPDSQHDVDRHENDLDRQADDIRKLETFKDDMKTLVQVVEYMWRCPQRDLPGQGKSCKDLILPKNPGFARKPPCLSASQSTTGISAKSRKRGVFRQNRKVATLPSNLAYKATKKHGEFVLPGFGKLVKQKRKARTGFNPKTQQKIKIPAKTVVKFRVAKAAKDAVLGAKK